MNFLSLFKPTRRPVTPPKSRLTLACEEVERLKDQLRIADVELFAAASEALQQGKLIWVEYKGYGIVIGTRIDITYRIDVHTMTYLRPPIMEPTQIHNVKIGDIRIVHWKEVGEHPGFLQWIIAHPLAETIHKVNR